MKKGVQLYAVRALANRDLKAALKVISEIGYEGVEFAGFGENSAEDVKAWLEEYNLCVLGAHIPCEDVLDKPDEVIGYHKAIGNNRIIIPWSNIKTKADTLALAEKIKAVAPKYAENGMRLYYHNHNHEFVEDDGEYLIDILAQATTPEELFLEFDVYWVYNGGACPICYLNKYKNRVDIFHAKDGINDVGTTLGDGAVELKGVFKFAKEHSMEWAVVESETSEDEENQINAVRTDFDRLCEFMK